MRILKHKKGILNSSHFYLHFEGVLTNFEFNFLFMIALLKVIDYIRLPLLCLLYIHCHRLENSAYVFECCLLLFTWQRLVCNTIVYFSVFCIIKMRIRRIIYCSYCESHRPSDILLKYHGKLMRFSTYAGSCTVL